MFTDNAIVKFKSGYKSKHRDLLVTQSTFVYEVVRKDKLANFSIPIGFETDNATVPDWIGYFTAVVAIILALLSWLIASIFFNGDIPALIAIISGPFYYFATIVHPNDKRIRQGSWGHDYIWKNKKEFIDKYGYSREQLRTISNQEMFACIRKHKFPLIKSWLVYFAIHHTYIAKRKWKSTG